MCHITPVERIFVDTVAIISVSWTSFSRFLVPVTEPGFAPRYVKATILMMIIPMLEPLRGVSNG